MVFKYGSNTFSVVFAFFSVVILICNMKLSAILQRKGYAISKQILNGFVIFFFAIPGLIHLVMIVSGMLLAAAEDWPIDAGVFHFKKAFGLVIHSPYDPLLITSGFGKFTAMVLFGVVYAWFQFIMGFSGGIVLIQNLATGIPPNGYLFYIGILSFIIPCGLAVFSVPFAIIFSVGDDMPFVDAWLSTMSVVFLVPGASGFDPQKMSDAAQALLKTIGIWAVAMAGGIIGFCAVHPACISLLNRIQVVEDDSPVTSTDDSQKPADAVTSVEAGTDANALQDEIAALKQRVKELEAENDRLKEYKKVSSI